MKRILLGSTALIGAALLTQPAAAQLEVVFSGSVAFSAGYWDEDADGLGADGDFGDFQSEADFALDARGTADNGLVYSATIDFRASTTDDDSGGPGTIDETYITLRGSWGSLQFGDRDGPADTMDTFAPTVGIGQIDGDAGDYFRAEPGFFLSADNSDDSTKIAYYTERFSGFQFGVSYAPYTDGGGQGENVASDGDPNTDIEAGVNYDRDFGGFNIFASAVYHTADDEGAVEDSPDSWALGLNVGFGPFTVGGAYAERNNSDGSEQNGFNVGATYSIGPWGFGAGFGWNDLDGVGGSEDVWQAAAGAVYTLAPGLTAAVDVNYYEDDDNDTDGVAVIGKLKAGF